MSGPYEADHGFDVIPEVPRLWYVYILEVTSTTGRICLHVGIALRPLSRLSDHRAGRVKATAGKALHLLLGHSPGIPHGDALREEMRLKRLSPARKRKIALNDWSKK